MGASGARVRAENFSWHHLGRGKPSLAGLTFEIPAGQKVLLVGPSGAGKSTLLHALAGLLADEDGQSASGSLEVEGQDPTSLRGVSGLMQQDPEASLVLAKLGDDTAFGPENLGVEPEEIWQRVEEAHRAVGLDHLPLDHPTSQLSGGQKQRLGLAGILAMRPRLLLLDEPTANLDPDGVLEVRDAVVAAAQSTGATLLVVEHRIGVWAQQMDRILVLDREGAISHDGPPSQVLAQAGEQLAAQGVWVPGHRPLAGQDFLPPAAGELLLSARDLAVSRQQPGPKEAKAYRKALAAGQQPSLPLATLAQGINLDLYAGQHLALTGKNGAGKSTLALTLAGLLYPAAGSVSAGPALLALGAQDQKKTLLPWTRGRSAHPSPHPLAWSASQLTRRLGLVFQNPEQQFICPTVRQELEFSSRQVAKNQGQTLDEAQLAQRIDQLLEELKLAHLQEANPFTLSGGEKRRLSVATALATAPGLLILDEPTFGQDAQTWAGLVRLIRQLLAQGKAVISVTHDQDYIDALGGASYQLTAAERGRP